MATNQSQSIQINPAGGLSKDEVERLVDEAARPRPRTPTARDAPPQEPARGLIYTCDRVFEQLREGMEAQSRRSSRRS
jgi:hypothetical protein